MVSRRVARDHGGAANTEQTEMNTVFPCYSDFFGVSPSRPGLRIRNDEVVGSIPTSSTIFSVTYSLPPPESCHKMSQFTGLRGRCLINLQFSGIPDVASRAICAP